MNEHVVDDHHGGSARIICDFQAIRSRVAAHHFRIDQIFGAAKRYPSPLGGIFLQTLSSLKTAQLYGSDASVATVPVSPSGIPHGGLHYDWGGAPAPKKWDGRWLLSCGERRARLASTHLLHGDFDDVLLKCQRQTA